MAEKINIVGAKAERVEVTSESAPKIDRSEIILGLGAEPCDRPGISRTPIMTFGQFFTKVCERLKEAHEFRGAFSYVAVKEKLLDIIYEQYTTRMMLAANAYLEEMIIADTAQLIDEEDSKIE